MNVRTDTDEMTAEGPAVEQGLMCESAQGELLNLVIGWREPEYNIGALKRFTCDDGSGTFTVRLQARLIEEQGYPFRWVILDGTGDYEGLRGAGGGWVEDPYNQIPNHIDHHIGRVHIEPAQ